MPKILVTGGLGFIGSAFLRGLDLDVDEVVCVDANTYAADERRLPDRVLSKIRIVTLDVVDSEFKRLMLDERPDRVFHFAAESHVTRSEMEEALFFRANVEGTEGVFSASAEAGVSLAVHISTDEVYGPVLKGPFVEEQKEPGEGRATSAYARSKAVADDVAGSFGDRIPVIIARLANCFGPWQHPEKAIARWTTRTLLGEEIPVWGDGKDVRDWMYVDDACVALDVLTNIGQPGEAYNVAPESPAIGNLEVARLVAEAAGRDPSCVYLTAYDRPGHDRRYAIDSSKLRALGWRPKKNFQEALEETVHWYADNEGWWRPLLDEAEGLYQDEQHRDSDTGEVGN